MICSTIPSLSTLDIGFKEIRLIPGKKEIAFVEYSTILEASAAKNVLDSFEMAPGHHITVSYAAK